ncbi:MAG TPA: choice-of-anchor Q domain-containing protein, partial [Verrucomicrobiae bacterium]|nr:choice-of-anchor Q domain-containing protein [Verrucomicrobiae bacterium]
ADWKYRRPGGGTQFGISTNCVITRNRANQGGGSYGGQFFNCTIADNVATNSGGGVYGSASLYNSIAYYNSAPAGADPSGAKMEYCCTTPPVFGNSNVTNPPIFADRSGGNLRLQSNSPCINTGRNAYAPGAPDLDGDPRIAGGTVDIGAYEFQSPASIISYAWLQQYGLPMDGSADDLDSDGDGLNNWKEWKSGTIPTNAAFVLQLSSPSNSVSGMKVKWQSVGGVTYYLQRSTNLPAFDPIQSNLVGQAGSTTFTDLTATNGGPFFYRVGVQ